jgi:hypothetical protein
MKMPRLLSLLILISLPVLAAEVIAIKNPGFEDGLNAWTLNKGQESNVSLTKEGSNTGEAGLRISDQSETDYIRLVAQNVRVEAGKTYKLRFFVNQRTGSSANVHFWFLDSYEEPIEPRTIAGPPFETAPGWKEYEIVMKAPADASYAEIHIQSNRLGVGVTDFDDFVLEQLD